MHPLKTFLFLLPGFLCLATTCYSDELQAQQSQELAPGTRVRAYVISANNGVVRLEGALDSLSSNYLHFTIRKFRKSVSLPLERITKLEVLREKSSRLQNAGIGAAAGLVLWALLFPEKDGPLGPDFMGIPIVLIGGVAGALIKPDRLWEAIPGLTTIAKEGGDPL